MNDFNKQLYGLGLKVVVEKYIKNYFDIHGEIPPADGLYSRFMNEVERPLIEETLRRMKGNQVRVAKILGINRNTLRRKIQDLNISLENI
jgi:two-component system nitrogen regulation response regulator GlnG